MSDLTTTKVIVILGITIVVAITTGNVRQRMHVAPLPTIEVRYKRSVSETIVLRAVRAGLPPHIALATAQRESKLIPGLVSAPDKDGGRNYGVMQLHKCVKLHFGCVDWSYGQLHDTVQNIDAGIAYLVLLRTQCHSNERCIHQAYLTGRINPKL